MTGVPDSSLHDHSASGGTAAPVHYSPIGVTQCWRCGGHPAVIWIEADVHRCRALCLDCRMEVPA